MAVLSPADVYRLAVDAGLDHDRAVVATAIAWGESGLNSEAVGDENLQDDVWGPSIGLWQVRSLRAQHGTGGERDASRLKDPAFNARAMVVISRQGNTWQPWTIYKNGAYRQYLEQVRRATEGTEEHTMSLVSRDEWGARPPRSTTPIGDELVGVACHWEGPHMGWPWDHDSCAGRVRSIQAYHMDSQGWNDVAYNALVCGHGYVFAGRGPGVRSGANGDAQVNSTHYAICYVGGEGDEFTTEARQAFNDAAAWLDIASGEWVGHRDLTSTACPGDEIYAWVRSGHPGSDNEEEDDMAGSAELLGKISEQLGQIHTELQWQYKQNQLVIEALHADQADSVPEELLSALRQRANQVDLRQ